MRHIFCRNQNSSPFKIIQHGFSLIELLVAISLLSIVLIGGFAIFNLIQENYLREAGRTNQVREARSDADTLFINFHDNVSFNASSVTAWPIDDPATNDNETNFSLTALWGNDGWINGDGDYECRLTAIDTTLNTFGLTSTCFTDKGVTQTALKDALVATPLPSVILVGASHPCIITDASGSTTTTFDVQNGNCLTDAGGTDLPTGSTGAGVIFPRFVTNGVGNADILSSLYYDHFGVEKDGAGIYFGLEETWRTSSATLYEVIGDNTDNFTSSWVNIHDFNERNTLTLNNPRDIDNMSLIVEVTDNDVTNGRISLNAAGTSNTVSKSFLNQTDDNISTTLQALHIRAPNATDKVDILFTLVAGDMVWSRTLQLKLE